jgi:hypothetical protein
VKGSKTKSLAMQKADRYFGQYIRKRDSKNGIASCITCGKFTQQFDAGHFLSRRFQSTRYDERNVNAQCLKCNRFENGNQYTHGKAIDEKYGEGTADELLLKSRMACKRTKKDFEYLALEFKQKLESL